MFESAKWICASMPEIASWRGRRITDEEEETLFALLKVLEEEKEELQKENTCLVI